MTSASINRSFTRIFKKRSESDKQLEMAIKALVGKKPINLELYQLAIIHSSVAPHNSQGVKESNERLEYLGDAVLDLIVAEYLFKRFPLKDEGFLTDIRARIVNRESLNNLAKKVGVNKIVKYDSSLKNSKPHKSIFGNTLEAIVGAVYLDRGYDFCKEFVLKRFISRHFDIEEIVRNNPNQKSKIIEWAQKENKEVRFELISMEDNHHRKEFVVQVFVDDEAISKGFGTSKKRAEQDAAQKSCELLKLI